MSETQRNEQELAAGSDSNAWLGAVNRLRQYVAKASFSSSSDRFSALECLDNLERIMPKGIVCAYCGGSGWVTRDPDIGTEQECFVCSGRGFHA